MVSSNNSINVTKRIGLGLSFILFPLIFIFAFATHPNLLDPHFLNPVELIQRAHNNTYLHFGHALVTLCTGFLVVVVLHFMNLQKNKSTVWFGFVGGVLAIFGILMLAVDKGALCLTMSALDTNTQQEFINMMPGLLNIFAKEGFLFLLWGLLLLPIGCIIQVIGLFLSKTFSVWQSILFLVGMLFIGTPDGAEIINLIAAILVAIACVPYGFKIIMNKQMEF